MDTLGLVGLALPVATAHLLLRPARRAGASPILLLGLALGAGLGIASFAFFAALILFDGQRAGVIGIDVLLLAIAGVVWRRAGAPPPASSRRWSLRDTAVAAAVGVAALASAVSFLANTADVPHGRWDAWATWNLRARALAGAGPEWRAVFAKPTIHGDYPLLLPGTIARLWVYGGDHAPSVPAIVAAAYAIALVLLLYGALDVLRGRTPALVGTLCLLGTPLFLRIAPWQYADVPLAFNLLAVLALLALAGREAARPPALMVWAGVSAALTAWTKNEGMVLVLGMVALWAGASLRRRNADLRAAACFAAGLLPLGLLVLYFKKLAPPSPQLAQSGPTMLARLVDLARYGAVLRVGGWELLRGTMPLAVGLVLYALLLGRTRDARARTTAAAVARVVAFGAVAYCLTYVTSRADPTWYVGHSVDRLELQLWPSALLALLLYIATPAEREAAEAAAVAAARPRSRAGADRRRRAMRH